MEHVIEPYCNVAVANDETNLIMTDVTRKLNGYDSTNGLGVLHGLLHGSDNVDLLKKLLELGVDPEQRSMHLPGSEVFLYQEEAGRDLNGGTALHFAVRFGRAQCFKALVDAGANLEARTAAGTRINGLGTSRHMKEVIVSFLLKMYSKAS
jgi:ankyrin repeat protein